MEINDLIKRFDKLLANKNAKKEEWLQLEKDMEDFMKEDHPVEEKIKLGPLGYLETVTMMCDDSADD